MRVEEISSKRVVFVDQEEDIVKVASLMRAEHVGSVIITAESVEGRKIPVGIVTDRDIVTTIVAKGLDPRAVLARDVMVDKIVTCREGDDAKDVIRIMARNCVRRVPVIGRGGELVGIVSADDIMRVLSDEIADLVTVSGNQRFVEGQQRA